MKLCTTLIMVFALAVCTLAGEQRISVRGKLMCGDSPASGIRVKIVDEDTGGVDDTLDSKTTGSDGTFHLTGQESEITDIDVYLKIYHKCNVPITQICATKIKVRVPDKYINKNKPFNFGEFNLESQIGDVETDCIH